MKELLKVLEFTADRAQALADSQSVAGEPLHVGDVTLIPVSSISCGFAGGGSDLPARTRNDAAAAGSGATAGKDAGRLPGRVRAGGAGADARAARKGRKIAAGAACPAGRKGPAGRRGKEGGQGRRNASGKDRKKRSLVDAPAACAAYQKPRRVRCPQAAKKIRSFSPAACTSEKIPLSPPVCKSPAFGGRFVRAADCDLFVGKARKGFPNSLLESKALL